MLKQLIQRLLDSRTTAAEAAHSAMPKPETPTIVSDPVTDKTWHSLIAPFDGYFSCKGITKHMLIENSAAQWSGVTGLTSGGYMGFTLPMSKGSEVRYQLDHNSTGVMMTFSKTIGGGYLRSFISAVCKRGELCRLKALSLCLPRSFCKASILTLLINVGRVQQYRTKTFREEVNKISLPHLVVGPCFRLEGLMTSPIRGSDLKTPQERLAISLTPLVGGNGLRSRYRRVTQSLWILASTRVRGILLLFATNRQNNFVSGGAAC